MLCPQFHQYFVVQSLFRVSSVSRQLLHECGIGLGQESSGEGDWYLLLQQLDSILYWSSVNSSQC